MRTPIPGGMRPAGSGSIKKRRFGPGYEAWTPTGKGKPKSFKLGEFDFYHQADRALKLWIAENDNAERKAG